MKDFNLSIMTPTQNFFHGKVTQLNLHISNGRIGFLAEHISTISSIKTSKFSVIENGVEHEGVIIGGIVYMDGKEATIITSNVIWKKEINVSVVNTLLSSSQKDLENSNLSNTERSMIEQKVNYYKLQIS